MLKRMGLADHKHSSLFVKDCENNVFIILSPGLVVEGCEAWPISSKLQLVQDNAGWILESMFKRFFSFVADSTVK